jgi:ketol-acid reductoisomerase
MITPRMLGEEVRRAHLAGVGFFSYVSVERDASGEAERVLLALADAVGSLRRGALTLPARQEALLDLFVEQTFGVYLGLALQAAFQVGTEAGLPAEAMALELYMSGEMSRTLAAFAEDGFFRGVTGTAPPPPCGDRVQHLRLATSGPGRGGAGPVARRRTRPSR